MANKDNSERIERYLREQMSPEENDAFLNDLRNDKDLREEAQIMALMIKEMKEEQARQSERLTGSVLNDKDSVGRVKTIRIVRWSLSIAAMFILIFGATQLWNKQSDTDALFNNYYSAYDITLSKGGEDDVIKTELAELYNKVGTEKDMSPIISRLQTIYDNILSGNDSYADYIFYENDIAWYLALAYLKDHNVGKAKELLKPLADNGDVEATKLLKAIESLEE